MRHTADVVGDVSTTVHSQCRKLASATLHNLCERHVRACGQFMRKNTRSAQVKKKTRQAANRSTKRRHITAVRIWSNVPRLRPRKVHLVARHTRADGATHVTLKFRRLEREKFLQSAQCQFKSPSHPKITPCPAAKWRVPSEAAPLELSTRVASPLTALGWQA